MVAAVSPGTGRGGGGGGRGGGVRDGPPRLALDVVVVVAGTVQASWVVMASWTVKGRESERWTRRAQRREAEKRRAQRSSREEHHLATNGLVNTKEIVSEKRSARRASEYSTSHM